MKKLVGSCDDVGFAQAAIEEVGGGGESLSPPWVRHGRLYKESTDAVIECTKNTFSLAILLGGVWAGEVKDSAIGGKEGAICSVVKFSSIIGLKSFNGGRKLRANISIEHHEKVMNFRLFTNRKRPSEVRKII